MKNDLNDLKKITHDLINEENIDSINKKNKSIIKKMYQENEDIKNENLKNEKKSYEAVPLDNKNNDLKNKVENDKYEYAETIVEEETLSLLEKEIEMIKRALLRSKGRRKLAAKELGISERTLYRKIKQFDLNIGSSLYFLKKGDKKFRDLYDWEFLVSLPKVYSLLYILC